jgi:hypothetical protein
MSPKDIIQAVLADGTKLTKDHDKLKSICEQSGIQVDASFTVLRTKGDPMAALHEFFKNLSALPVVKIAAKMASKKFGINL